MNTLESKMAKIIRAEIIAVSELLIMSSIIN